MIKSNLSKEFVLCFVNSKDLRIYLDDREDFLKLVSTRFTELNLDNELKVYGVPIKELKDYKSNNTSFSTEPESKYLLIDESVMKNKLVK